MDTAAESASPRVHAHAEPIRIPRRPVDARRLMARIARTLRDIERVDRVKANQIALHERRIREIEQERAERVGPLAAEVRKMAGRLRVYIERNRDLLTQRGRIASVKFATGDTYGWRTSNATDIPDLDAFYREVEALGWGEDFIRTTKAPNRSAILDAGNAARVATLKSATVAPRTKTVIATARSRLKIEGSMSPLGHMEWTIVDPEKRT